MLATLLGLATLFFGTLTALATAMALWITGWRPWVIRLWGLRVPREPRHIEWEEPMQDHPIPWS